MTTVYIYVCVCVFFPIESFEQTRKFSQHLV